MFSDLNGQSFYVSTETGGMPAIMQSAHSRFENVIREFYIMEGEIGMKGERENIRPRQKPGVVCKQMGEEMVLYDTDTESLHALNATAHFIWNLCDGEHSLESMVESVKINFGETEHHDVLGQVQKVLDHFKDEQLLQVDQ